MESEAKYAVVGAFVFAIASAALVFVIWLGQVNLDREYAEYQVVFKGPVRGLSQSGEVRFNGIKVGEVRDLRLDSHDPNIVLARIQIFAETPVKEDSYAQLEPQGITGLAYIQIYGGTTHGQKLLPKPGNLYAQIPTKQAQLEGLVAGGEDVLLSANTALVRVIDLLSTKNLDQFSQILANLNDLSSQFSSDKSMDGDIGKMVRSITKAANSIELAAIQMAEFAEVGTTLLEGDTTQMIAEIDAAANELEATSATAKQLIEQMSEPMAQFSNEGLSELTLALTDLRAMLQAVERVVEEVDRSPGEFIAGEPVTEVEVPR
ncbi:ABC transporter, substrate-binding protein (cluster 9, phospholipid) [hydrothermal vent metagenome]|uniref:ABC transporter, substrate-binding protein (Cluster 9, phospholipid) n=1 Tax=hydrothermal vent metagenome TaxID=652676 RepID=A0A3B0S723_9ZZZZ